VLPKKKKRKMKNKLKMKGLVACLVSVRPSVQNLVPPKKKKKSAIFPRQIPN
jgi:hypothetical protein